MLIARPVQSSAEVVGENLHVTRQHHQVDVMLGDQFQQPGFGLGLGVGGNGEMDER